MKIVFNPLAFTVEQNNAFIAKGCEPGWLVSVEDDAREALAALPPHIRAAAEGSTKRLMPETEEPPALARLRELRDLPARIPELRRQAVEELLAQGWSRQQIATELGISRQSVYEWGK